MKEMRIAIEFSIETPPVNAIQDMLVEIDHRARKDGYRPVHMTQLHATESLNNGHMKYVMFVNCEKVEK